MSPAPSAVLSAALILSVPTVSAEVRINEFMASNGSALHDGDGNSSDWIEIWNSGDAPVNLDGWTLTDDPAEPAKWPFPAVTLQSDGYLLVFASGQPTDTHVDGAGFLHSNFALTRDAGGYLALVNGAAQVVDAYASYPRQVEDISYGRYGSQAPGSEGYLTTATPGAVNGAGGFAGIVADTTFSVDRGIYDAPFTTTLASATPGASLIYTTDGTVPASRNGTRVPAPDPDTPPSVDIPITTTTTLRAIATKTGYRSTNVDTHSYIVPARVLRQSRRGLPDYADWGHAGGDYEMDPDIVHHSDPEVQPVTDDLKRAPTVSLVMDWDEMFGVGGIYISGENVERATSIEYLNPEGDVRNPNTAEGFQVDGTVQIVGGSSVNRWKSDKLSMRLKFSPDLCFDVFGPARAGRFDTLVLDQRLNNVWHYGGGVGPAGQRGRAQYTRDQFPADLHNLMGGISSEGKHVLVYINGVFWGISELHERPDDNFAAEYLGGDNDDYDVIKHSPSNVVQGSSTNYNAMLNLTRQNMADHANYEAVTGVLDIDNFIAYMLANYYVGNTDWAHHNWYASFNKIDRQGRWRYHSWDPEHCIENTSQDVTGKDNSGGPTEVFNNLIANPEFKLRFADAVQKHFHHDGVLTPANAATAYRRRADAVDLLTRLESARWGDNHSATPFTRLDWLRTRDQLLGTATGSTIDNYFPLRTGIVLNQFTTRGWLPTADAPAFSRHGGPVAREFPLEMSTSGPGTIFYTLDGSDPRQAVRGSAGGTAYTGPVPLTESGVVKARLRLNRNTWSALTEATFIVGSPASPENLVVSEIMYHPAGSAAHEFIELMNISATETIDLTGVKFTTGITFEFPLGTTLAPGARTVVVEDTTAFDLLYGTGLPVVGQFTGKLDNGGEQIVMAFGTGDSVLDFTYDDDDPWPTAPDGSGVALILADPWSRPNHSAAASWQAGSVPQGSPGTGELTGPFAAWMADRGATDPAAPFGSSWFSNLLAFTVGADLTATPGAAVPAHVIIHDAGTAYPALRFRVRQDLGEVTYTVEHSEDLALWHRGAAFTIPFGAPVDNGDGTLTLTVRSLHPLAAMPYQYLRLRATLPGAAPGPFEEWMASHGTTDPAAPFAASSLPNLLAFTLGADLISVPEAALPRPVLVDEAGTAYPALRFRLRKELGKIVHAVELSEDLALWNQGSAFTTQFGAPLDNGDGTITLTVRSLQSRAAKPHQYLRLRTVLVP